MTLAIVSAVVGIVIMLASLITPAIIDWRSDIGISETAVKRFTTVFNIGAAIAGLGVGALIVFLILQPRK